MFSFNNQNIELDATSRFFFYKSFPKSFFRKTAKKSSAGFPKQSSRKRNKVRPKDGGSSAPVYAGLQLDCAGVPAMLRLFFHKVQKNQNFQRCKDKCAGKKNGPPQEQETGLNHSGKIPDRISPQSRPGNKEDENSCHRESSAPSWHC